MSEKLHHWEWERDGMLEKLMNGEPLILDKTGFRELLAHQEGVFSARGKEGWLVTKDWYFPLYHKWDAIIIFPQKYEMWWNVYRTRIIEEELYVVAWKDYSSAVAALVDENGRLKEAKLSGWKKRYIALGWWDEGVKVLVDEEWYVTHFKWEKRFRNLSVAVPYHAFDFDKEGPHIGKFYLKHLKEIIDGRRSNKTTAQDLWIVSDDLLGNNPEFFSGTIKFSPEIKDGKLTFASIVPNEEVKDKELLDRFLIIEKDGEKYMVVWTRLIPIKEGFPYRDEKWRIVIWEDKKYVSWLYPGPPDFYPIVWRTPKEKQALEIVYPFGLLWQNEDPSFFENAERMSIEMKGWEKNLIAKTGGYHKLDAPRDWIYIVYKRTGGKERAFYLPWFGSGVVGLVGRVRGELKDVVIEPLYKK